MASVAWLALGQGMAHSSSFLMAAVRRQARAQADHPSLLKRLA